jgi:hypothetical protein
MSKSKSKIDKKVKFLHDNQGREVPIDYIDKVIKKRHFIVMESFEKLGQYIALTQNFKKWVFETVKGYLDDVAGEYHEKWQGNATIMDFSQTKRIEVDIQKYITFDERLNIAKLKIDNCMKKWSEGSCGELRTLVMDAFRVDKKGNVDTKLILGLRQYKFDEPDWNEAMDIIAQSLLITGSKTYIRFASRTGADGRWVNHVLNFSAMDVSE